MDYGVLLFEAESLDFGALNFGVGVWGYQKSTNGQRTQVRLHCALNVRASAINQSDAPVWKF